MLIVHLPLSTDLLFVKIPLKEAQGGFRYIIIGMHYLDGSY